MLKTFTEVEPIIDSILEKNRPKWKLGAVKFYDFDDFKQDLKIHVYEKFDKWNQSRAFEPWCSAVIHNQIQNKKRNLWRNHEKPCADCYFNKGMGMCGFTKSGDQCGECQHYRHWEKKKQAAYNMKMACPVETEDGEILFDTPEEIDYDKFLSILDREMNSRVKSEEIPLVTYKIFKLNFIEGLTDEEIARKMGYKTRENDRSAGYRTLASHRKKAHDIAKEILGRDDYNFL